MLGSSVKRWLRQRKRTRKKLAKLGGADVVIVSFAKSGRTWLAAMISRVFHLHYGTPEKELVNYDNFHRVDARIPRIFFTADNFRPREAEGGRFSDLYRRKRVILLVRDPRDTAVSFYFQLSKRATQTERDVFGAPSDIAQMSLYDFVIDERFGVPKIIEFLNRWQNAIGANPERLVITYEEMRADPLAVLRSVMRFIGGEYSEQELAQAVDFASFENLKERERESFFDSNRMRPGDAADADSFKVRRAKVGGYRDYFTPPQIDEIDRLTTERLSPELGYVARVAQQA
jgi:hypothetical protein